MINLELDRKNEVTWAKLQGQIFKLTKSYQVIYQMEGLEPMINSFPSVFKCDVYWRHSDLMYVNFSKFRKATVSGILVRFWWNCSSIIYIFMHGQCTVFVTQGQGSRSRSKKRSKSQKIAITSELFVIESSNWDHIVAYQKVFVRWPWMCTLTLTWKSLPKWKFHGKSFFLQMLRSCSVNLFNV